MRKSNTAQAVEPASDLRQRAARARDAAGRFIKRPEPIGPDPVHALIEQHRSAYAEWDRLSAVWCDMEVDAPGYREAVAASNKPGQREIAAYKALFSAQPTTLAGTAALGAYLSEAIRKTSTHAQPTDGERALSTVTAAIQQLDQPSMEPHPDAALFALGYEFISAWVSEEAVGNEAAYRECTLEAERIAQTPATTVAGLGIKALLLARLDSDDSGPNKPIAAQGPLASHWNVLRQIQKGAARLAAEQPTVASKPTSVKPDLSALTVFELARLYPVLVRVGEVAGSAENSPCFWNSKRTERTPAGQFINWEADRLLRLGSAVAAEISRRQSVDRGDQAERANTLLTHMVLTGGVEEHPELISEICATWGSAR